MKGVFVDKFEVNGHQYCNEANHCQQQNHPSSSSCSEQDLETCRNEKKSCYICDFLFVYIYVFVYID